MRKYLYFLLFAVLVAGFQIAYFSKRDAKEIPASGIAPDITPRTNPSSSAAERTSESAIRDGASTTVVTASAIPIIDGTNPNYAQPLAILERSFLRMLEWESLTKNLPPERVVALANRLAVLRLSQTMYEATIASVSKYGDEVKIAIPAYPIEGEALRNSIFVQMFPEIESREFKAVLGTRFGYFGKGPQEITVRGDTRTENGEQVYSISHFIDFADGSGSTRGSSQLSAGRLGYYAPFHGFFPKS